jgi:hypothetical protein
MPWYTWSLTGTLVALPPRVRSSSSGPRRGSSRSVCSSTGGFVEAWYSSDGDSMYPSTSAASRDFDLDLSFRLDRPIIRDLSSPLSSSVSFSLSESSLDDTLDGGKML